MDTPELRRPPVITALALILMICGVLAMIRLPGHLDSPIRWLNFVTLIIGVGLWTTQEWARWLGIGWAFIYIIRAGIKLQAYRSAAETPTEAYAGTLVFCILLLGIIVVLFKYRFEPVLRPR